MNELPEELLERYRAGETEALGELVELYRKPLFGFILSMVRNRHEAEEIFQEVWYKAIRSLDRYKSRRFLSWLFRIARNHVIDGARKKKPHVSLQQHSDQNERGRAKEETIGSDAGNPLQTSGNRELAERIEQAVAQLPIEQREVFLMRTKSDLPFKQIARIQETSINTSLARMQYALSKLRDLLREDYETL